jgi:flavin-dependent dehydrogenase
MPRAVAAVARMGIVDIPGHVVRGARFINTGRMLESYEDFREEPSAGYGLMVQRSILDDILLRHAETAGAEFRVGTVRGLLVGTGGRAEGVSVEISNGLQNVKAPVIVAASGASSGAFLGGRVAGGSKRVWGAAARKYLAVERHPGHDLQVYFPLLFEGRVISGYAWIFPVSAGMVNVGVGVIRTKRTMRVPPAKLLEAFIADRRRCEEQLRNAVPSTATAVAPLALSPISEIPHGVLLTGDLAGLANPFTGEGIAAALESGELAARAILSGQRDAGAHYRQLLLDQFRRNFRLAPLLRATHEQSEFFLGRGSDILLRPKRIVGTQVRRLVWDRSNRDLWWLQIRTPCVRETVQEVQRRLVRAAWHVRPMFGGLVAEMTEGPEARFGRYAAFAIASRAAFAPERATGVLDHLIVLEAWGIIGELHRDLLRDRRGWTRDAEWGCDTMSIVLADALNAIALQSLCRMTSAWIDALSELGCRLMRTGAEAAVNGRTMGDVHVQAQLYRTAARLGLGTGPAARLDPALDATARCLAESEWVQAPHAPAASSYRIAGPMSDVLVDLLGALGVSRHEGPETARSVDVAHSEGVAPAGTAW